MQAGSVTGNKLTARALVAVEAATLLRLQAYVEHGGSAVHDELAGTIARPVGIDGAEYVAIGSTIAKRDA